MNSEINKLLQKNLIKNISLLNFAAMYDIQICHRAGSSVLLIGRSDERWVYISSDSVEELKELLGYLERRERHFAVLEEWMIPYICKMENIKWHLTCMRLYLPGETVLPEGKENIYDLTEHDIACIYTNSDYQTIISTEYIKDRITRGVALGIGEAGNPAAWVLTHDDGAIGFLHVKDDYRRQGYGKTLLCAVSNRIRQQGKMPFLYVETENYQSMSLVKKVGFKEDRVVTWLEKE